MGTGIFYGISFSFPKSPAASNRKLLMMQGIFKIPAITL